MAGIFDLSNELLIIITDFVRPRDLDSFFQTSRRIRELNAAYIPKHKRLTRTYRCVTYDSAIGFHRETGTLARFLKDALTSPRIAEYAEEVDLDGWKMSWDDNPEVAPEEDSRRTDMLSETNQKIFHEAIKRSRYVPTEDVADWIGAFEDGAEDQILGLLFTLLPHLSVLNITEVPLGGWNNRLSATIKQIAHNANSDAFKELTRVVLSSEGAQVPFPVIKAFAALPSMRRIYAKNVYTRNEDTYGSLNESHVTQLSLPGCRVQSEILYKFLGSLHSLAVLDYTDGNRFRHDVRPHPSHFRICNSLIQHAKHSLKKLTIRAPAGVQSTPIGSLEDFVTLEKLDVDNCALLNGTEFGPQRLTEILPRSIQEVVLRHPDIQSVTKYLRVVQDVIEFKKQDLPHLRCLDFRPYHSCRPMQFPLPLFISSAAAGISLTVK